MSTPGRQRRQMCECRGDDCDQLLGADSMQHTRASYLLTAYLVSGCHALRRQLSGLMLMAVACWLSQCVAQLGVHIGIRWVQLKFDRSNWNLIDPSNWTLVDHNRSDLLDAGCLGCCDEVDSPLIVHSVGSQRVQRRPSANSYEQRIPASELSSQLCLAPDASSRAAPPMAFHRSIVSSGSVNVTHTMGLEDVLSGG